MFWRLDARKQRWWEKRGETQQVVCVRDAFAAPVSVPGGRRRLRSSRIGFHAAGSFRIFPSEALADESMKC